MQTRLLCKRQKYTIQNTEKERLNNRTSMSSMGERKKIINTRTNRVLGRWASPLVCLLFPCGFRQKAHDEISCMQSRIPVWAVAGACIIWSTICCLLTTWRFMGSYKLSPLIWVISLVTLLITPLRTTHEPPSTYVHAHRVITYQHFPDTALQITGRHTRPVALVVRHRVLDAVVC